MIDLSNNKTIDSSVSQFNPDERAEISPYYNFSEYDNYDPDSRAKLYDYDTEINLAGVEKGREMTFTEADSGNVNPNFEECEGFQCNCQTCVVVFEARLRGYDIEACPFDMNSNAAALSSETNLAWLTPEGKHPDYIMNLEANTVDSVYDFISEVVKPGERYTMEGNWKEGFGCGHIISVFREESGNLVFYDPQVNMTYNAKSIKENFLNFMQKGNTEDTAIKLLRVDNLDINIDFIDSIVRRSQNYA